MWRWRDVLSRICVDLRFVLVLGHVYYPLCKALLHHRKALQRKAPCWRTPIARVEVENWLTRTSYACLAWHRAGCRRAAADRSAHEWAAPGEALSSSSGQQRLRCQPALFATEIRWRKLERLS